MTKSTAANAVFASSFSLASFEGLRFYKKFAL